MKPKKPNRGCDCTHKHSDYYHEPLEVGRQYLVREGDLLMGFGLTVKKTTAPYLARILSLDKGFARCFCTDGETRELATPQLTYTFHNRTMCGM